MKKIVIEKTASKENNCKKPLFYYESCREAFYNVLDQLKSQGDFNLLVPAYIGFSPREGSGVFDPINELNISHVFYKMNDDITIDMNNYLNLINSIDGNKVLLLINYFGYIDPNYNEIIKLSKKNHVIIIEDCAHALFTDYIDNNCGKKSDFVLYSLHKMLPYNNGGMLKVNKNNGCNFESTAKLNPFEYDFQQIAKVRKKNAKIIEKKLSSISQFEMLRKSNTYKKCTPQTFPMILKDMDRSDFYCHFNDNSIGVVALYHTMIDEIAEQDIFSNSVNIGKHIINLPVHQDITSSEINKMCDEIIIYMNNLKEKDD